MIDDPCTCFIPKNSKEEERRSTGFVLPENAQQSEFQCDRGMQKDWYRFMSGAGTEIPMTPSSGNACGKIPHFYI